MTIHITPEQLHQSILNALTEFTGTHINIDSETARDILALAAAKQIILDTEKS